MALPNSVLYFDDVFREDLQEALSPKSDVDHTIDSVPTDSATCRSLYHLSPAELVPNEQFISDLLVNGEIRQRKWPYDVPRFSVKDR